MAARMSSRRALTGRAGSKRMLRVMNSAHRTGSIATMDKPERRDTAQRALVYTGIAIAVVVVLVLAILAAVAAPRLLSFSSDATEAATITRKPAIAAKVRAAGGVLIGKTNVPEFGAGSQTSNPVFGTTRNPYDPTRVTAGSSGGSISVTRVGG